MFHHNLVLNPHLFLRLLLDLLIEGGSHLEDLRKEDLQQPNWHPCLYLFSTVQNHHKYIVFPAKVLNPLNYHKKCYSLKSYSLLHSIQDNWKVLLHFQWTRKRYCFGCICCLFVLCYPRNSGAFRLAHLVFDYDPNHIQNMRKRCFQNKYRRRLLMRDAPNIQSNIQNS